MNPQFYTSQYLASLAYPLAQAAEPCPAIYAIVTKRLLQRNGTRTEYPSNLNTITMKFLLIHGHYRFFGQHTQVALGLQIRPHVDGFFRNASKTDVRASPSRNKHAAWVVNKTFIIVELARQQFDVLCLKLFEASMTGLRGSMARSHETDK